MTGSSQNIENEFEKKAGDYLNLQKHQLSKTRILAAILGSVAIISIGFFIWTNQLRVKAEKDLKLAETQLSLAEAKTLNANQEKLLAEKTVTEAHEKMLISEVSQKIAEKRRIEAEVIARNAQRQEAIAQNSFSDANRQMKIALENEKEANRQREKAENARIEAFQKRMLSTARTMALKSIQITNDPDLKALIAYQAFQFNEKYNGNDYDADIYSSLYQSVKTLMGLDYNALKAHQNAVQSLMFLTGTSTLISSGIDGKILKWNINDPEKKPEIIAEGIGLIEKIKVTANSKLLTVIKNQGGILVFDLNDSNTAPFNLIGEDENIREMVIGPDNKTMFTTGLKPIIEYWDLESKSHSILVELDSRVISLALLKDGGILAGGTIDGSLIIWRVKGTTISQEIYKDNGKAIHAVAFSNDGKFLACGNNDGDVLLFTAGTFQFITRLKVHTASITEVEFSPDSKMLASSSYDGKVLFWELANLTRPPIVLEDISGIVYSIAFSPDGEHLLSSSSIGPYLINNPTMAKTLAIQACRLISRNLTGDEWKTYVAADIPYEKTCPGLNN